MTNTHDPIEREAQPLERARDEELQGLQDSLTQVVRLLFYRPNTKADFMELSIMQVRALNAIAEHEDQKLVDLAARLAMALPGASRTVERLVKRGFVHRMPDPNDRRAVRLILTDHGQQLVTEIKAARAAELRRAVTNIDLNRLQEIHRAIKQLADEAAASTP